MGVSHGLARVASAPWSMACLLFHGAALAAGVAPDTATAEQTREAQAEYEAGVSHFKKRDFGRAAEAFERSYEIVASPNSHLMQARALAEAGNATEAYEELALVAAEARTLADRLDRYRPTAATAEEELERLGKLVGVLRLRVTGDSTGATVFVGPRQIPPSRWAAVAVEPGTIDVVARVPGGRRVWKLVEVKIATTYDVELDLATASENAQPTSVVSPATTTDDDGRPSSVDEQPPGGEPSSPSMMRWASYGAGAVGVVGLATFAIAGSMSRATFNDLEDGCPGGRCPDDRQDDIDRGKTQQTIANVGLVAGILGVGGGATLFVLDRIRAGGKQGREVTVTPGVGGIAVRGSF